MLKQDNPEVRSLLISEPFMQDPNFLRSVVLICEHSEEGTLGFVINHCSNLTLNEVVVELPNARFPLYIGGPVGMDNLQFIHRCPDRLPSGIPLGDGVFWGGDFQALKLLIEQDAIGEDEIKFFVGYSGWEHEQLAKELQGNSWMVSKKYNPAMLFVHDDENLWKEVIVNLGPKYAHVANFPINPLWN